MSITVFRPIKAFPEAAETFEHAETACQNSNQVSRDEHSPASSKNCVH